MRSRSYVTCEEPTTHYTCLLFSCLALCHGLARWHQSHLNLLAGKWNHNGLGDKAAGDQSELAGRAVRKGEPPKRTQTPCSLTLGYRSHAAQAAMVAPTFANGHGQSQPTVPTQGSDRGHETPIVHTCFNHKLTNINKRTPIMGTPIVGTYS